MTLALRNRRQAQADYHPRERSGHRYFLIFAALLLAFGLGNHGAFAQQSISELQKTLKDTATFDQADFASLSQNQTVVKVLPAKDPRDVAVRGMVGLEVPVDVFLQSFRESMSRKTSEAILEIGRFGHTPSVNDLHNLTLESRDLDDLKECVIGDCRLKLSTAMISRFNRELDPNAPDYAAKATQLFKAMLVEYVNDYLARGDAALIEYSDKARRVRMADEQRALMSSSTYLKNFLPVLPLQAKDVPAGLTMVENALVWSKIKFGLKPVFAINHIMVFKRDQSPQVIIASKQIYANHYFDSSLALTGFVHIPGASPSSFLIYENHSRADGLGGAFAKLKRGIIENRAIDGLKGILESSKANLTARTLNQAEPSMSQLHGRPWRVRKARLISFILGVSLLAGISTLVALFTFRNYTFKGLPGRVP